MSKTSDKKLNEIVLSVKGRKLLELQEVKHLIDLKKRGFTQGKMAFMTGRSRSYINTIFKIIKEVMPL